MMDFLNNLGAEWARLFGSMVVQNTVFLLVVFLLLFLLRNFSARFRLAVGTVGLIKLLVPPFVVWPGWGQNEPAALTSQVSSLLFPFQGGEGSPEIIAGGGGQGLDLMAVAMLAWLVVAVSRLGWALLATWDLRTRVRRSWQLPADQVPAFIRTTGIEVWQTRGVTMPLTMGLRPRRIYVPLAWDSWQRADRQAVLRHELAHIQNHDGVFRSLEILAQAVYFFHPLVILLVRRLNMLREMACDDRSVTAHPRSRLAYSRFLVHLAETALARPVASESASTLLRRKSELMNRVTYQMKKEGVMKNVSKKVMGLVLLVLLASALPLSLVYGEKKVAPPPPPPPPAKMQMIEVAMGKEAFTIDGKETSFATLKEDLDRAVAGLEGKAVVAIKADPDLPMGKLHMLQKQLQQMDLYKVVYRGETGKKLAMVLPTQEQEMKMKQMGEEMMVVGLLVDAKGQAHLSGMKHGDKSGISPAKAVKLIEKMAQDNPHLLVDLQTVNETPYAAMVECLGLLKQAGLKRIHIADPVS